MTERREHLRPEDYTKLHTVSCWQPAETAPKDKTIIANVGLPFAVIAKWNGVSNSWVYANVQTSIYHGEWNDYYFENEYEKELIAWMPMPDVENER